MQLKTRKKQQDFCVLIWNDLKMDISVNKARYKYVCKCTIFTYSKENSNVCLYIVQWHEKTLGR